HRYPQGEHTVGVVGADVVTVQRLPQEDLAGEAPRGAFTDHGLTAFHGAGALGADGDDVVLDLQVDGLGPDPGQIEADHELVLVPVGIHRHGVGRPGAVAHEPL